MVGRKIACIACFLCFSAGALWSQSVEKLSASFSFPTTPVGVIGGVQNLQMNTYFKQLPLQSSLSRAKFAFEWSVASPAASGSITFYSIDGKQIQKVKLSNKKGIVECDLGKIATGVYFASITYGSFSQNLKLAVYR
jgi:hypothetical protein